MNQIIQELIDQRQDYLSLTQFSTKPGIYALFFTGNKFPLPECKPTLDQIIYIGKTESSQASRDRDTHFASGKTGSSTLRRSFGAMLRAEQGLKPIPRGPSDILKKRWNHFKFDESSEHKLTEWMQTNLALSFHEHEGSMHDLDRLESELISHIVPVLNIDRKNPLNSYKAAIRALRKETGIVAYSSHHEQAIPFPKKVPKSSNRAPTSFTMSTNTVQKYSDIWGNLRSKISKAIASGGQTDIFLGKDVFEAVGNRKSYSFRLEIKDAQVANTIRGSAVARDLARVIMDSSVIKQALKGKQVIFRLDSQFIFHILVQ